MAGFNDYNKTIIDEFRANGGKVGGRFEGAPMLLLTSTGAKSGQSRINPLVYMPDGERYVIFASKGGAPTNPDWYHNLVAHPSATIEVGTDKFDIDASILSGAERDRVFAEQVERVPTFGGYQRNTTRTIPVIRLTRKN
jgi:deazaflavin-dependent oxidoreductase (nitroreductase family)